MVKNIDKIEQSMLVNYLKAKKINYLFFLKHFYGDLNEVLTNNLSNEVNTITIWDIIRKFETTINKKFKKLNGAVYTPYFIVDYINAKTITENDYENPHIIDPACGSGIFLIDALFKLRNKTKKSFREIVENNIYGLDIDPRAVKRTKLLLSLVVFENEGTIPEKLNIYNGNSLDKKFVTQVLKDKRFHAVVGNPPYVRIQNLGRKIKRIITHWEFVQGDTDLFIPFIELGIELLIENGKMGYITPNSYFTTYAGKRLRNILQINQLIEEIIDFDHYQVFEGITTYTAITIISKKKKDYFMLKKVENENEIRNLKNGKGEKIYFNELNPNRWRLVKNSERKLIEIIENAYYKLEDIADIRVGIATLADRVYILQNCLDTEKYYIKVFQGKQFLIEKEITKPIIKVSIIKNERDIIGNNRRCIFPYKNVNGKYVIIEENEMKMLFPKTYEYFLYCKEILWKRDKGSKEYETWYAFGRTQGINTTFGKKILTPPMALSPTFVVCEKEDTTFYSGYGIFPKTKLFQDLYVLKKILNSDLMKFYIQHTAKSYQGGWKSYSKTFLRTFGIPNFSESQLEFLKKENDPKIINEFLFEVYHG